MSFIRLCSSDPKFISSGDSSSVSQSSIHSSNQAAHTPKAICASQKWLPWSQHTLSHRDNLKNASPKAFVASLTKSNHSKYPQLCCHSVSIFRWVCESVPEPSFTSTASASLLTSWATHKEFPGFPRWNRTRHLQKRLKPIQVDCRSLKCPKKGTFSGAQCFQRE